MSITMRAGPFVFFLFYFASAYLILDDSLSDLSIFDCISVCLFPPPPDVFVPFGVYSFSFSGYSTF